MGWNRIGVGCAWTGIRIRGGHAWSGIEQGEGMHRVVDRIGGGHPWGGIE